MAPPAYKLQKAAVDPVIPYGKRLLPHIVDELARETPDRVVCKIAKSTDISKGFLEINNEQVAKAVDAMAYWLREKLNNRNGQDTTIAYMGAPDPRYWIMILAAIKIGSPVILPSMKNSVYNNQSLFNDTKCRNLFYSKVHQHRASDLASVMNNELYTFQIPEWADLLAQDWRPYPYTDTWDKAAKKPIMILHTSGSTGNPKPIVYNNAYLNMMDSGRYMPAVDGYEPSGPSIVAQGPRSEFYLGFPFFHMGGLGLYFQPFWYDCILVLGPTDVPANGKILVDIMKHTKLTAITTPPSLLEDVVKEYKDEFEKYSGNTKVVGYGGGPLAKFAGDYLSQHIPIMSQIMGSTEAGFLPLVSKDPEYWQAFHFHPTCGGIVFEQNPVDPDLYELVIKRIPGQEWCQGVFETFPDINEWRTKDHYKPHPTRKDFWLYVGRVDDMLVLSNGEKFIPVEMEHTVAEHPLVRSGLVVGQGRFQCAMIIELKDGVEYDPKVIDDIWPYIVKANKNSPAHAQVARDLVTLADPKKPFQRAPKGTIQRWKATNDYTPEINALYKAFESQNPSDGPEVELSSATDPSAIHKFLVDVVSQILPGREIAETDDFFVLGMDSLQTSQLASTIKNTLKDKVEAAKDIGTRLIYENPSIGQVKAAILALATGKSTGNTETVEDKMRAMVEKYTSDLPAKAASKPKSDGKLNVAVTGSTGSLGFYLILTLLSNPKFGKIYLLDRSAGCDKKFADRWAVLGEESINIAPGKLNFYQAEFGHPTFGLPDAQYSELFNNVNVIIHNAWKVNFNHPLASFDSQIRSVKAFAHLSLESPLHPEFFFVSSISTMGQYQGVIPERVVQEYTSPSPMGYGHSKYVSERIVDTASRERDVNMTVFRVGQIGGPVLRGSKGQWNLQEWFPSLVKTSGELGLVPKTLGAMDAVDWIPVDVLARVMIDLVQTPPNKPSVDGPRVYNLVNPNQSAFSALVPSIKAYYSAKGKAVKEIEYSEWLATVQGLGEDEALLEKFPAKKVQGFFEDLLEGGEGGDFETTKLIHDSATMKTLVPVGSKWIETWLDQWSY